MRTWVIALAALASLPAWGDSQFRIRQMTRDDVPRGKGQCDIRLQVDNEIEVAVRGDMVYARTLSGQEPRDDGSECNAPLPRREVPGLQFEVKDSRNEIRLVAPPDRRNDFAAIVHIRDSAGGFGRYHFRLSWDLDAVTNARPQDRHDDDRRAAPGFVWNNVVNFHGQGRGTAVFNESDSRRLSDVNVDVDRGGKIMVTFRSERGAPVVYSGFLMDRENGRLKASMTSENGRLRGTMLISVDERQNVNSITMEATDGRDRMRVNWDRR
ncbi:MAG TPA: hypothetical protein VG456_25160 [Candidatus Sulfopaludibacter sp.]|jgi:hypothetical protein|nr:hypothetical protein [Candidatus Sulfopaludibacter sp.]